MSKLEALANRSAMRMRVRGKVLSWHGKESVGFDKQRLFMTGDRFAKWLGYTSYGILMAKHDADKDPELHRVLLALDGANGYAVFKALNVLKGAP